jgi:hypothetical protein
MNRQILRNWVHCYNAAAIAGLVIGMRLGVRRN